MTYKSKNIISPEQKQEVVDSYKHAYKRMNFNGAIYFIIFNNAIEQYEVHKKEVEDLFGTGGKTEPGMSAFKWFVQKLEIELKMQQNELIAITFAVMFLECIIWDYAAVNTSRNLTEDLSKISLLGKWKIIPKLVNNDKKIEIGDNAVALLKKLQTERHDIIHSKSKAVPDTYDKIKEQERKGRKITIPETVECVKGCIKGLQKVDTTHYWYFEEEVRHTVKLPTFRTSKKKKGKNY